MINLHTEEVKPKIAILATKTYVFPGKATFGSQSSARIKFCNWHVGYLSSTRDWKHKL